MADQATTWVLYRRNNNEPARQASNLNLVIVSASSPEDARRFAAERNPFGEGRAYLDSRLFAVMSMQRLLEEPDIRGTLLIRGDIFVGPPIHGPAQDGVSVF